tara:strand:+ start:738 stop:1412 length:675 start_codon:yes stop_codon:yes gene_type:complete
MTLPSSGQLDFNSIRAEFSGPSSNVTMSTYNRGGTYVFAVPANADIPTSTTAQIEIPDFYGAKNKSDYSSFTGGSHAYGGKAAYTSYGVGGPNLPAAISDSYKIGTSTYTMTACYNDGASNNNFHLKHSAGPTAGVVGDSNWTSRNFYFYDTSGNLDLQFRSGTAFGQCAAAPALCFCGTYGSLNYYSNSDNQSMCSAALGQTLASKISGDWDALGQTIVVKAF